MSDYKVDTSGRFPIKAWTKGVQVEDVAVEQLRNIANMPFIHKHVAIMPDVHWGMGATIGSVIPCKGAIIPAAVGVDIGCGMMAVQTDLPASRLPDNLKGLRSAIEAAVPHGRNDRAHHLLAVFGGEILRPTYSLHIIIEQVRAFRQIGEILVRQLDEPPLHFLLGLLDEIGADPVAAAP